MRIRLLFICLMLVAGLVFGAIVTAQEPKPTITPGPGNSATAVPQGDGVVRLGTTLRVAVGRQLTTPFVPIDIIEPGYYMLLVEGVNDAEVDFYQLSDAHQRSIAINDARLRGINALLLPGRYFADARTQGAPAEVRLTLQQRTRLDLPDTTVLVAGQITPDAPFRQSVLLQAGDYVWVDALWDGITSPTMTVYLPDGLAYSAQESRLFGEAFALGDTNVSSQIIARETGLYTIELAITFIESPGPVTLALTHHGRMVFETSSVVLADEILTLDEQDVQEIDVTLARYDMISMTVCAADPRALDPDLLVVDPLGGNLVYQDDISQAQAARYDTLAATDVFIHGIPITHTGVYRFDVGAVLGSGEAELVVWRWARLTPLDALDPPSFTADFTPHAGS